MNNNLNNNIDSNESQQKPSKVGNGLNKAGNILDKTKYGKALKVAGNAVNGANDLKNKKINPNNNLNSNSYRVQYNRKQSTDDQAKNKLKDNNNKSLLTNNGKSLGKNLVTNKLFNNSKPKNSINDSDVPASENVKQVIKATINNVLKLMAPLLGYLILFVLIVVVIMVIVIIICNSGKAIKDAITNFALLGVDIVSTDESIVESLKDLDLCDMNSSTEECINTPAGKYYVKLRDIKDYYSKYDDYEGNQIALNIALINEILMYNLEDSDLYNNMDREDEIQSIYYNYITLSDILAEAMVEEYKMYGDYYYMVDSHPELQENRYIKSKSGETTFYRISYDKLNSYLLYGEVHENYSGETKEYDTDIYPGSTPSLIPGGREINLPKDMDNVSETSYSGNVKDGFIYKNILTENDIKDKNDEQIEKLAKSILEDIYSIILGNNSDIIYSNVCPGVNVTGNYAGIYSLEDYVAGVVQNENNWSQGDNIENMKAQAIAARTYVLRITNNCALPIENSTKKQTMNPNPGEKAKQAASETAGKVLTSNGKYISTEYDGLAVKEKTDEFYILKQADLQIPISWLDKYLSEKDYQYYANHTHGRGMSQWGSRYLQTIGYDYNKILKTFYPSAEITTLGGGGSQILANVPNGVPDLQSRYYFTFDIEKRNYYNNSLFGQCVWYAKHRAMEIVAANGNEAKVSLIENAYGNGIDIAKSLANKGFRYSDNIYDVRPGAIISWKWTDAKCRSFHDGYSCGSGYTNYGHVAVVESVTYDSNGVPVSVIITEGWRTNCGKSSWCTNSNIWSVVNFRKSSLTISALENNSGYGIFNGLAFLN